MDNKDDELCKEGSILWQDIFDGCEYDVEKYNRYMDHIKSCAECKHMLGIDGVISEDELDECDKVTMTTEDKLEALALREKACTVAYAEGVKDTLILAAVVVMLVVAGVYAFL